MVIGDLPLFPQYGHAERRVTVGKTVVPGPLPGAPAMRMDRKGELGPERTVPSADYKLAVSLVSGFAGGSVARIASAVALSLNQDRLPVMHQPVDHGGGQRVIDVERLAPVPEFAIRGDHDRSGFVTGSDDLEHQVRSAFVDGKISQLIKKEKFRSYELSQPFFESPIDLCRGQHIDHINHSSESHSNSFFTSYVPKCRQEMCFPCAGSPNQHGALMLAHEFAVE